MQIQLKRTDNLIQASIRGELVVSQASEAKTILQRATGSDRDLEIDLSDISAIDVSGIQILFSARRHVDALGRSCRFVHPSREVVEVLSFLGRSDVLDEIVLDRRA